MLKKIKDLREQMYKAAKEDNRDEMFRISKEWDALNLDVTSEMLTFEALVVAKEDK